MSGAARRRGGRGPPEQVSDTTSRRGGPQIGSAPARPGAFDGPASGGSGTNPSSARPGSQGGSATGSQQGSQQGSRAGSQPGSPRLQQGGFQSGGTASAAGAQQAQRLDPALDPAAASRYTDTLRGVDLPASFYNVNNLVRSSLLLAHLHRSWIAYAQVLLRSHHCCSVSLFGSMQSEHAMQLSFQHASFPPLRTGITQIGALSDLETGYCIRSQPCKACLAELCWST